MALTNNRILILAFTMTRSKYNHYFIIKYPNKNI